VRKLRPKKGRFDYKEDISNKRQRKRKRERKSYIYIIENEEEGERGRERDEERVREGLRMLFSPKFQMNNSKLKKFPG